MVACCCCCSLSFALWTTVKCALSLALRGRVWKRGSGGVCSDEEEEDMVENTWLNFSPDPAPPLFSFPFGGLQNRNGSCDCCPPWTLESAEFPSSEIYAKQRVKLQEQLDIRWTRVIYCELYCTSSSQL